MDHLLSPRYPQHDSIEIPYLGTEEYDGGLLETYPERRGWQELVDPEKTLSLVQTWLFFGLLATIFRESINIKDWTDICENPHRTIITTRILPQIASRWIDQQRALDEQTSERRRVETNDAILFVSRCIDSLYTAADNPVALRVTLSIELLGEFLQSASFRAYGTRSLPDWRSHSADEVNWLNHGNLKKSIVYQRLESDGWCPNEIAMLKTKFPGAGLYFISGLDRPGSEKDHGSCTQWKCFAYQLVDEEYETHHAVDGCKCAEVIDELDRVRSILKEGSIPVISFLQHGDSETLSIVEATPQMVYIAISHVWADGLGNLHKNALPKCQLRRLSSLVSAALQQINMTCTPYFWVDTVCCPPESGEAQDLAISRMRKTYENASCVLVLDSWLEIHPIADLSDYEIMTRIACCGWNRRLWTFQEGALAQRLLFQFADTLFDIDDAAERIRNDEDVVFNLTLQTSVFKQVLSARSFRLPEMNTILRIKTIMSSLKFRATSVLEDESLCLAAMLNLDIMHVLQTSTAHEERMAALWSQLPEVPGELALFGGPRLTVENLKWAPATLLSPINAGWASIVKYSVQHSGIRSTEGLRVRFPGFELACPSGTVFRTFYFLEEESRCWYEVCCYLVLRDASDATIRNEERGEGFSVDGLIRIRAAEDGASQVGLALITQVPIARPDIPKELRSPGVLASIVKKENGIIFASFLCNVTARRLIVEDGSAAFNEWRNGVRRQRVVVQDDLELREMLGEKAAEDQVWCIG